VLTHKYISLVATGILEVKHETKQNRHGKSHAKEITSDAGYESRKNGECINV